MCICLITACLLNVGVISFEKDENVLALVRQEGTERGG